MVFHIFFESFVSSILLVKTKTDRNDGQTHEKIPTTHKHTSTDKSWHFYVQFVRAQRFFTLPLENKTRRNRTWEWGNYLRYLCTACMKMCSVAKMYVKAVGNWNVSKECRWASCIYMFRSTPSHEMSFFSADKIPKEAMSCHKCVNVYCVQLSVFAHTLPLDLNGKKNIKKNYLPNIFVLK